jgi:hypothetical protein
MSQFKRYIGIDYSGAEVATASLKGLRVYQVTPTEPAHEVLPHPSPRKYWTRKGIAHWLAEQLATGVPTIVGIDHGFSFPLFYFATHKLPLDWDVFLDDFQYHWPTDQDNVYVDFVRHGQVGHGQARQGNARWRRACELRCKAKSVFHFDVQGSVAKSTHSGIPWLRYLRKQGMRHVHFWPFDGWDVPAGKSVVLEAYPALYKKQFDTEDRTPDQHDAYSIARWLSEADREGRLDQALHPVLTEQERALAPIEGWILGVDSSG